MRPTTTCGISTGFPVLSPTSGQVAHVLLTRSPLGQSLPYGKENLVRLACVRHAASVNPEPGSNSPSKRRPKALALSRYDSQSLSHSSVVKVLFRASRGRTKHRCRKGPAILPPGAGPATEAYEPYGRRESIPRPGQPSWPALQGAAARHRPGQRELVGVFEVAPKRQSMGGPGDLHAQGGEGPMEVGGGRLAFDVGIGGDDHLFHPTTGDPLQQLRDVDLLRADVVDGR